MKRRTFIRNSSLAALSIPAITLGACTTAPGPEAKTASTDSFALNELTVNELQRKMEGGEYTSRSITELYLKRIGLIDKGGPVLNSVIEINPDALSMADALDLERKDNKVRGPLHGIPVLIKDNIDTGDKMMTTAGSLALDGNRASQDAFIIKQLRNAGAVLLGKTNLSEWANFRSTRSSSGWSSRGGQTRNPYILDRSPCGSSSGSGTAVAANLCALAIGTETNGSIACPASTNGIVGIKPTVGLWSRAGIIPISQTQDTAGPLTRTVTDAALLLGALAGIDENDPVTKESNDKSSPDYTQFLKKDGLKGKRIGFEKSLLKKHEGVDGLLQKAMEQMKSQGAEIVEVELLKELKDLDDKEFKVLKYEFKDGLNRYLSKSNSKIKSLQEVINFNNQNDSLVMPWFKQEILVSCQELGDLQSKDYLESLKSLLTITRNSIDKILKESQLHSICGPANGPSWCIDLVNGDFFTGYGFYSPAAVAGYPSITVPLGKIFELPVGLSFIGTAYSEGVLLEIAYAYEQISRNRVAPRFQKSTNS